MSHSQTPISKVWLRKGEAPSTATRVKFCQHFCAFMAMLRELKAKGIARGQRDSTQYMMSFLFYNFYCVAAKGPAFYTDIRSFGLTLKSCNLYSSTPPSTHTHTNKHNGKENIQSISFHFSITRYFARMYSEILDKLFLSIRSQKFKRIVSLTRLLSGQFVKCFTTL